MRQKLVGMALDNEEMQILSKKKPPVNENQNEDNKSESSIKLEIANG